jgi:hypothetical protein
MRKTIERKFLVEEHDERTGTNLSRDVAKPVISTQNPNGPEYLDYLFTINWAYCI